MEPFNLLSEVFGAAAALEALGTMLLDVDGDLPSSSAVGVGHLLKLLHRDLQQNAERVLCSA